MINFQRNVELAKNSFLVSQKKIPQIYQNQFTHQNTLYHGQLFNHRYRIESKLGEGGMGIVYKAYDTQLKRIVALKTLLSENQKEIQRFLIESQAMAQLSHPNIVRLYDVGEFPQPFLTMEYVEGITLANLIKEKKIKSLFLINMMIKVCNALAHAHKHNILHRDLKPSNIMVHQNGEPKIMDFGLAKMCDRQNDLSKVGDIVGTIFYMAPEQILGKPTRRSDIYSIGATIYEALTYRSMYQGDSYHNIVFQILHKRPIPPRRLNSEISPYIEAVCLKCIAKKEHRRYNNFKQLAKELQNLKEHRPILAKKYTSWDVLKSFVAKHVIPCVSLATVFMVLCISILFTRYEAKKKRAEIQKVQEALNKAMRVLKYSMFKHRELREDQVFSQLFSKIFSYLEEYGEEEEFSFIKGFISKQAGNYEKSLAYYTENIRKNPLSSTYNNRGNIYQRTGRLQLALVDYNKALELEPRNYRALCGRGNIYQKYRKIFIGTCRL